MTTAEKTAAEPDYWFVDPAYYGIDRLAEDECPMDEVQEGYERERREFTLMIDHAVCCKYAGSHGLHAPENCPDGGV